jgi:hypothetical protein
VQGENAEQYVSAVNRAYDLLGLEAPGRMPNSSELAFEVQTAIRGFIKRLLTEDHIAPTPTEATPAVFVFELCKLAAKGLRAGDLKIARAALSNVFQFYMIWRPTMAAAITWSDLGELSATHFSVTMRRDMLGRKNKSGAEKTITRRRPADIEHADVHFIPLFAEYRRQVDELVLRRRFLHPVSVWQLPTEGLRPLGSSGMGRWLKSAASKTSTGLPAKITPRCHRNGSSTLAYRLLNDYPDFCIIADWEMTGSTFQTEYFRPNLEVDMQLARFFFADLTR